MLQHDETMIHHGSRMTSLEDHFDDVIRSIGMRGAVGITYKTSLMSTRSANWLDSLHNHIMPITASLEIWENFIFFDVE